ncbi:hypothetical protein B0H13DRAFT_2518408 [Mycena leptocephala]|nr:hypothetical protein B0H13DRAFT_2518408 [Mycena leptocephala]
MAPPIRYPSGPRVGRSHCSRSGFGRLSLRGRWDAGGFYVTPDEEKAQLFGATFLADNLAQSALQVQEVSAAEVNKVRCAFLPVHFPHRAWPARLRHPALPQEAEGGGHDARRPRPSTRTSAPTTTPPSRSRSSQLDTIVATKNSLSPVNSRQTLLLKTLDDFKTVDVVAGAGPLTASQKVSIEDAGKVGTPALKEPFNQVVLVTDKAMKALTFITQEDLPTCLAEKQPLLVDLLKGESRGGILSMYRLRIPTTKKAIRRSSPSMVRFHLTEDQNHLAGARYLPRPRISSSFPAASERTQFDLVELRVQPAQARDRLMLVCGRQFAVVINHPKDFDVDRERKGVLHYQLEQML